MSLTHWKKLTNPDYLGAYALESGKDMILTIKNVTRETVTGAEGKKEECTIIHFAENVKPMICNATNAKMIQKLYGTPYIEEWSGRAIQIYIKTGIKVGGETTDGLRIRPAIPQQTAPKATPVCADCGVEIEAHEGATGAQIANATYKKYGKPLCLSCAEIEKNKQKAAVIPDPLEEINNADT